MMKKLPYTLERMREVIKEFPTPFHIYDEKELRLRARRLKAAFSWNKGFKEYFAVKALPNPFILDILRQEGCGLDCSSMAELVLSKSVGCVGEDIMFSSNNTPPGEFAYARKLGALINLDDFSHIDLLQETGGIPRTVCLRYNPGGEFKIGNMIMGRPGEAKYGMTRAQILRGVQKLMELGAEQFGLHAFLSSNTLDADYYPELARELFSLAVEVNRETGAQIAFVNLSGGIGIPYRPQDEEPDLERIGALVRQAYRKTIQEAGLSLSIKTELGRFLTGPAGSLVTTAIHYKDIHKQYIGVDACAANLLRPAMYGAYHHITVLGKEEEKNDCVYDIVGSLCENNDKFAIDRALPKIDMGDILVIHDTGAHGFSMGYNYNGRLRSKELLLKPNGKVVLIRRAETLQDYFATLEGFGFELDE